MNNKTHIFLIIFRNDVDERKVVRIEKEKCVRVNTSEKMFLIFTRICLFSSIISLICGIKCFNGNNILHQIRLKANIF